jgi:hypothetical protein
MFGKKKDNQPKEPPLGEILKNKIAEEIEALTPGQTLIYQLPEFYTFARFFMVSVNPEFPQKGKKYLSWADKIVDGKPAGMKMILCGSNKALDAAKPIAERDSEQYGHIKRYQ